MENKFFIIKVIFISLATIIALVVGIYTIKILKDRKEQVDYSLPDLDELDTTEKVGIKGKNQIGKRVKLIEDKVDLVKLNSNTEDSFDLFNEYEEQLNQKAKKIKKSLPDDVLNIEYVPETKHTVQTIRMDDFDNLLEELEDDD